VVRSIKNQMTARYLEVEGSCAENKMEQLEKLGAGALRRATEGDIEMGALMAGQIAGLVKEEAPAAVIIERIMDDVVKVLKKAQNLL
jgi:enoyl-[acyl-carrier protein] reductase II